MVSLIEHFSQRLVAIIKRKKWNIFVEDIELLLFCFWASWTSFPVWVTRAWGFICNLGFYCFHSFSHSVFRSNQYERHTILWEKPHIKTSTSTCENMSILINWRLQYCIGSGFRLSALGYTFTGNAVPHPLYFAYTFRMPR